MKTEVDMEKTKRQKTRFHKILFVKDTLYRQKVVANKKKKIPRNEKYKDINTSIED